MARPVAHATRSASARLRGTALGWALGVGRFGAVLAPQLSGLLMANSGLGATTTFVLFGFSIILAAVTLFGVLRFVRAADAAAD